LRNPENHKKAYKSKVSPSVPRSSHAGRFSRFSAVFSAFGERFSAYIRLFIWSPQKCKQQYNCIAHLTMEMVYSV
jgi:hypothetical protein